MSYSNWIKVAIEQDYITLYDFSSFGKLEFIGGGGCGAVFHAIREHESVALKCLHNGFANDSQNHDEFFEHNKSILVHNDVRLMITDFGLSKSLESDAGPIADGIFTVWFSENCQVALYVIYGNHKTPIDMTPANFMNLYHEAWNYEPTLRPSINNITDRLESVQMVPVYRSEDNQDQFNDIDISINT
ncbi:15994_t:CDS:2, partial [Cetraspora pellucida]